MLMFKKISAVFFAITLLVIGVNAQVYAHFKVEDLSTGLNASFHITPDHEPIAGEESVVSYDFSQSGYSAKNYAYELSIGRTNGGMVAVPLEARSNVVIAPYIFPSKGLYKIELSAKNIEDGKLSHLEYTQRVSKGAETIDNSFNAVEKGVVIGTFVVAGGALVFAFKDSIIKQKGSRK